MVWIHQETALKPFVNFTNEIYLSGELATVYTDEQFCKIPQYTAMFQIAAGIEKIQQVVIQETQHPYYSLIPFQSTPDRNQSFIIEKSINFENVYNMINLFKLFKFNSNPLNDSNINVSDDQLKMFNLGNKFMLERLGQLIGEDMTVKEGLLRIASFINNIQETVITYYELQQKSQPSVYVDDTRPRRSISVSGGSIRSPSSKSPRTIKDMNHFVLIAPDLKLYVITVEINNGASDNSGSNFIVQPDETLLSSIELENIIEIKGCLLRQTDIFAGMIRDDKIPPYTIGITEVYDFN
jgi:hypothetical protein